MSLCPAPVEILSLVHQREVRQRDARTQPSAVDAATIGHVLTCPVCLQEFKSVVADIAAVQAKPAAVVLPKGSRRRSRLRFGSLIVALGASVGMRSLPAFRSAAAESGAILHSAVVPLDEDYVIMELASSEREIRLNLEQGAKNSPPIQISLYTGTRLSEKRKLQNRLSWDLTTLPPGGYRLHLQGKLALKFDLRE